MVVVFVSARLAHRAEVAATAGRVQVSAKADHQRKGFEWLHRYPATDPSLAEPAYATSSRSAGCSRADHTAAVDTRRPNNRLPARMIEVSFIWRLKSDSQSVGGRTPPSVHPQQLLRNPHRELRIVRKTVSPDRVGEFLGDRAAADHDFDGVANTSLLHARR